VTKHPLATANIKSKPNVQDPRGVHNTLKICYKTQLHDICGA